MLWSSNSMPGPFGIPVFGSLLSLVNFKERTLFEWSKIYGPVFQVGMGSWNAVSLQGYETIRSAFVDREDVFSDRPVMDLIRSYRDGHGLLFTEDDRDCKRWKKFLVQSLGSVWKHIDRSIAQETEHLVDRISELCGDEEGGKVVDVISLIPHAAANVLMQTCFSRRYRHDDGADIARVIELAYGTPRDRRFGLMVFLPWLRVLPSMKRFLAEVESRHAAFLEFAHNLLTQRWAEVGDDDDDEPKDLATVFRKAYPEANEEDVKSILTIVEDMFFGGTLPLKSQFSWVLLLLLKNPRYVRMCQDEIDRVFGGEGKTDEELYSQLHLTRAVMEEGIRLRPSVPTANFHCTKRTVHFAGFTIPPDTMVIPNIYSVHHDPQLWAPDPEAYRPERHLDARGCFASSGRVIPFSIGRRSCAGKKMASRQIFLYLVALLRHFRLALHEPHLVDVEGVSVSLSLPKPYGVVFSKRSA